MGGTFKNWNSLIAAMKKEVVSGVTEATEDTYEDLHDNVQHFYDSSGGIYQRTYQLAASPMLDGISETGNGAVGQVSINTGTQYDPAGRDTNWIYHVAEDGGLIGNGGFWEKTENQAQENLDNAMSKRFK